MTASLEARRAQAYWVTRPRTGELRTSSALAPKKDQSWIRTTFTGVSVGTERLVGCGEVPADCTPHMACRYMEGDLALPVKYGYSLVGQALEGALAGQHVFVMHPHQDYLAVADEHATVLPAGLPAQRGVLIPNLETALNAVWDAEMEPDDTALVVGGGAVGLLVAYVLWRNFGRPIALVEIDERRATLAAGLPWVSEIIEPADARQGEGWRVSFHASGHGAGLQTALDALGFEGRVLELSWYGTREVGLDLGADFHYQRKRIQASQVGSIATQQRGVHDHASRLQAVLRLLDHPELDALLGDPVPFANMPAWMDELYRGASVAPLPLIEYSRG